jgi:RNA-directed DNA polymerase
MPKIKSRSILKLNAEEARQYFLEEKNYCASLSIPKYISFQKILEETDKFLTDSTSNFKSHIDKPDKLEFESINHVVYHSKDGKYSWRPLTLIHPVFYVYLVHLITQEENWKLIQKRLNSFSKNKKIGCMSIPVKSQTKKSHTAEQISKWWGEIEQKSLTIAYEYDYLFHVDIEDCYGSIYTHSISWALHGKQHAKKNRKDDDLLGNKIDRGISDLSYGQTNGIPQGSALWDFIAEIVLGYADSLLSEKIKDKNIENYQILRYRDDYRIFVNSKEEGKQILKLLTEVLLDLGLKLNASKTRDFEDLIGGSIKPDKLYWILNTHNNKKKNPMDPQKDLLRIHHFALKFPNSGTLKKNLNNYRQSIRKKKLQKKHVNPLISIVLDILFRNPKVYNVGFSILSILIQPLTPKETQELFKKIKSKFEKIPNTGHYEIWLQRLEIKLDNENNPSFNEKLCKIVQHEKENHYSFQESGKKRKKKVLNSELWNCDWIKTKDLKAIIEKIELLNIEELNKLDPIIEEDEVNLFAYE